MLGFAVVTPIVAGRDIEQFAGVLEVIHAGGIGKEAVVADTVKAFG